jgi:20S proteasome subunit beta 2
MTITSELHMVDKSGMIGEGVPMSGFNFDNIHRNAMVQNLASSSSVPLPSAKKTGTTIVGMTYDGGVVLGADTRSTGGSEVAEKNCIKIHYIAPNIYCCGAGTAADTAKTTELISSQLELLRMDTHSDSRVITAVTKLKRMLFRYQGYISAALVLGGCDVTGPHVYQIYPHGSTGKLPYTTMGSGSLAAMAMFESSWRPGMNEKEAVALVQRAIGAGIFNDLGSGGSCDTCVIRMDGTVDYTKGAVTDNEIAPLRANIQHSDRFNMKPGTTPVLKTTFQPHPTTTASLADVTVTEMEVDA